MSTFPTCIGSEYAFLAVTYIENKQKSREMKY